MTTATPTTSSNAAACCTQATNAPSPSSGTRGSCCAATTADTGAPSSIEEIKAQVTPPEVAVARSAGFRLLLEAGTPVEMTSWAAASGMNEDVLQDILDRPNVAGRVELDDQGRLLGIAGLTIEPTHHKITVDGEERWTWCALDAVGILGALESDGTIRSVDPHSGDSIEIAFQSGEPTGDAVLFILGGYEGIGARDNWCPLVNFFCNRHDAEAWATERELAGEIVSIRQISAEATAMWRPVTDPTSSQAS